MPRCGATTDENGIVAATRVGEERSYICLVLRARSQLDLGVLRHHHLLLPPWEARMGDS